METQIQFLTNALFTFLVILLITLKLVHYKICKTPKTITPQNLPPGPWKLPIIGNLHQLFGADDPHIRLRVLARKHGDLMHLQLGELSHVVISSAEIAREMTKAHDINFSQRPSFIVLSIYGNKSIGQSPYGEYWRQIRRICWQNLLSPVSISSFRTIREEEVSKLIKDLYSAPGSKVNLSKKIFSLVYRISAKAAFGKVLDDQEEFITNFNQMNSSLSIFEFFPSRNWLHWIAGYSHKVERFHQKIDDTFERIVQGRRSDNEAKTKCLLDVLLEHQLNGDLEIPMEPKNVKGVMLDITFASNNTTSTSLEWTMLEMLKNPRVMNKAQAEVRQVFERARNVDETRLSELTYLKLVIKESLRMHPPVPFLLPRESKEHCVIHGHEIPSKTRVLVNAWSIGRDPRYWTEPDTFYPERFIDSAIDFKGTNFELIPFGTGRRRCPGALFAIANIEIILAQLLFHFDWKLPDGICHEELDMSERFSLVVRPKEELYVVPIHCMDH